MKHEQNSDSSPKSRASWLKFLPALALAAVGIAPQIHAHTYGLSNEWTQIAAASPTTNNIDTANDTRGMCYDPFSNQILVNNKTTKIIEFYDGGTGTSNGVLNYSGYSIISSGNFAMNKIGFGTNGILYGANLQVAVNGSAPYKLYAFTNLNSAPYVAYSTTTGDAIANFTTSASVRIGDTFAIIGGGTNTMILAVINGKNDYVLLSTADGTNFSPTVLAVTGLPTPGSGVQLGFAFYTNNTFMVSPDGGAGNLYLVQFPANFASLSSPVAATTIATNSGFAGNWVDISYNASAGLLAAHPNAVTNIYLYSLPSSNFGAMASLVAGGTIFGTSTSINGNETGDVALAGTNAIYTMDTSAGLQGTAIVYTAEAVPPAITTEPAGGAVYTNVGAFSFSVSATGTLPISYQWQYNSESNLDTAENIAGATNASFTLSPLSLTNSGWYDVVISNRGGVTSSIPVELVVTAPVSSPNVSVLWNVAPSNGTGAYPYLDSTSYDTRGLAYDTNTSTILVADKGSDIGIYVLDANTGSNLFAMNTIGIGVSGNQFNLDQVGVADDGVVYACNLFDTGSTADSFAIFSWSSVSSNAAPQFAYPAGSTGAGGDPSGAEGEERWGDTMAVRGAGLNTQIILGSYAGYLSGPATNAVLFTTPDGASFSPMLLTITNAAGVPSGFSSLGIAFGAGNTFWAKSPGYDLRQIAFDPVSGNCSVLQDISTATNGAAAFSSMSAIAVDPVNNVLAGITFNDIPNDLSLFVLGAATNTAPYMFDQAFFPSNNGNSQDNGATVIKYPRIYSLDVNNGIVALTYSVPLVPFTITSFTGAVSSGLTLSWATIPNHTYQVQYATLLSGPWTNLGAPIVASGPSASYTDTSASGTARFYRVVGK